MPNKMSRSRSRTPRPTFKRRCRRLLLRAMPSKLRAASNPRIPLLFATSCLNSPRSTLRRRSPSTAM
ncbi:hypothetical protein VTI28DRAFT_4573 [Corynascus sepedonium]